MYCNVSIVMTNRVDSVKKGRSKILCSKPFIDKTRLKVLKVAKEVS